MECLREQPVVSLADPGQAQTFIADVFQPRPAFDEIARFSEAWSTEAAEKMQQVMTRKKCPVTWVQLVIDQHGMLAILRFQHELQLCDAKKTAKVVLGCLPDKQRLAVESLRPLDEVDRDRLAAWQTVESLRPAGKRKRPVDESDDEYQSHAKRAKTESNAKSMAELLAELSDGSSSEEEMAPPRLMLANGSSSAQEQIMPPRGAPSTLAVPSLLDSAAVWEYRAKRESVIIVAEAGERPERLAYVHCNREPRRQLLLQSKVREEYESPGMPQVVRVAMQLAAGGSMPGPGEYGPGKHGRKTEFIKRCAAALRALDPSKETELKKLGAQDQALVRKALGGDTSTPYKGCLNEDCLDKETVWETSNGALLGEPARPMSRCARCKHPNVFGRGVNSVRDILRTAMECERGRMTPIQLCMMEMDR